MRDFFLRIIRFIQETPSALLLLFVFIFIIPHCLSYDNAWLQPEIPALKVNVLRAGPNLSLYDLKHGLNAFEFNGQIRCTRPLSSYFEILDTKFRCWLWKFMMPHPSLSLTWIFSLILAPLLLYGLLRNRTISTNTAIGLVSLYLATPGVLSYETMLFKAAKPMTNFAIILCLYVASLLQKYFIEKNRPPPLKPFIFFWLLSECSIYWDETALLIFPCMLVLFPGIFKRKLYLFLWLLIPIFAFIGYYIIIPYLSLWTGNGFPHLNHSDDMMGASNALLHFIDPLRFLGSNAKSIIFDTMGLIIPHPKAPFVIKITLIFAAVSWLILFYYLIRVKNKEITLLLFLAGLILFFNYSMYAIGMWTWGPYWYGTYWSIFFVFYLARLIEKAHIPKTILTSCLFFILLSMSNSFLATNTVYKKFNYYPYGPGEIEYYFNGQKFRFDPLNKLPFTGQDLKKDTLFYWIKVKNNMAVKSFSIPKELCWLPIELEPDKHYEGSLPGTVDLKSFTDQFGQRGKEIFHWLWDKNHIVRWTQDQCFIKDDLATIQEALNIQYPDDSPKIMAILQASFTRGVLYYNFAFPDYKTHPGEYFSFKSPDYNTSSLIHKINNTIPLINDGPVYFSFPGSDQTANTFHYQDIFLRRYPQLIKQGHFIVPFPAFSDRQSILNAHYFYDIYKNEIYDLIKIKALTCPLPLTNINNPLEKRLDLQPGQEKSEIIFFIKGNADITLKSGNKTIAMKQNYGDSYQIFSMPIEEFNETGLSFILLQILPVNKNSSVTLLGPFIRPLLDTSLVNLHI